MNGRFMQQSFAGVQRYGHELLKAWDRMLDSGEVDRSLYSIEVLAPQGELSNAPVLRHIPIRQAGRLHGPAWVQLDLPRLSRDGLLFSTSGAHPVLALGSGRMNVVTVHDLSYLVYPRAYSLGFHAFYRSLIPIIFARADAIITVSNLGRAGILQYYPKASERVHVIYNGAPAIGRPEIKRRQLIDRKLPPWPFVLWVGSLSKRKNPQGLIDAIQILRRNHDIGLLMAGAGHRSFKDARLKIPPEIADRVWLLGQVDDEAELADLYEHALCLAFPSFYESFGLPVMEAMAYGTAVVASTAGSLPEVAGDAAILVDPSDVGALADAIGRVATDADLRADLIHRGKARVRLFSWDSCGRETLNLLAGILDKAA